MKFTQSFPFAPSIILLFALLLLLVLPLTALADSPTIDLADAVDYTGYNYPADVALGDVNNDGWLDMVVADATADRLRVRLGDGAGGFGLVQTYQAIGSTTAVSVTLVDLNKDGWLDIASVGRDNDYLGVLKNDGDGTFSAFYVMQGVAAYPQYIESGDLDNDGDVDLVVSCKNANQVCTASNNDPGGVSISYWPAGTAPEGLCVADLNNDGWLDIAVVTDESGTVDEVSVLWNNGAADFLNRQAFTIGTGKNVYDVQAADLNNDGWLDLVFGGASSHEVLVMMNDGAGSFGSVASHEALGQVQRVLPVDLNSDGILDVVATDASSNQVAVYQGVGDGGFSMLVTFTATTLPTDLAAGDIDKDGKLDLVVCNRTTDGPVGVYMNETGRLALEIVKVVTPEDPSWGDTLTYTVQISNTGGATCTGVMVTDTFPSTYVTDVVSATSGLTMSNYKYGAEWGWTVEDMAPGDAATITLTGVLTDYVMFGEVFTNTAEIGCAEGVTATASAEATVSSDCVDTFTVINNNDSGPGSLRQGLAAVCDGGVIDFDLSYPATITLTSGELDRSGKLTITGPGPESLAVSGNNASRVINSSSALTITSITLRDGKVSGGYGGGAYAEDDLVISNTHLIANEAQWGGGGAGVYPGDLVVANSLVQENVSPGGGGGLYAWDFLTITNSHLISNTTTSTGGGAYSYNKFIYATDVIAQGNEAGSRGGALYAFQGVTVSGGRFSANRADSDGGALYANGSTVSATNTEFLSNSSGGKGGAIYAFLDAVLEGGKFISNTASSDGGAATSQNGAVSSTNVEMRGNTSGGSGGALRAFDTITITGGRFENNVATQAGGAAHATTVSISGTQFISNTQTADSSSAHAGGAVYYDSSASVENARFERNVAANHGGGIGTDSLGNGVVTITNTAFISNTADAGGGAHGDEVTLVNCTATGNQASANGGAAAVEDEAKVVGGTYADNTAGDYGGAVAAASVEVTLASFTGNTASTGGAVIGEDTASVVSSTFSLNSATGTGFMDFGGGAVGGLTSLTIINCEFYSNTSVLDGGAGGTAGYASVTDSTFQGNTAAQTGGAICISMTGQIMLDGSTFEENVAGSSGGAVYAPNAATIMDSEFTGNTITGTQTYGGAVWLGGESTVTDSRFQENVSRGMGGAVGIGGSTTISNTNIVSNTAWVGGGGVVVDGGLLTMQASTVAGNIADDGDGTPAAGAGTGGGIQVMDAAQAILTNCTIANNEARGGDDDGGGGIVVYDPGQNTALRLTHCTIVGNRSASDGGGLIALGTGAPTFVMTNTIVAGNLASGGSSPDISGTIVSNQGNVVGNATGSTGLMAMMDQWGSALSPLDALLGDLGNYGGDTETIPLLPGSPAVNVGAGVPNLDVDQRGVTRDWSPDSGAFESRGFQISTVSGSNQSAPAGSAFAQPLVVGVSSGYAEPVDGGKVEYRAPMLGASATLNPADPATISGGQTSVVATANEIVGGPYQVYARIPQAEVNMASLEAQLPTFVLTNLLPLTGEGAYSVGPATVCPGYNVYHTVVVSNTSASLAMEGLVVTGTVPATNGFYGVTSPAGGVYDAATREIVWTLPSLAAGDQAVVQWTTHVLNGTPTGTVITSTASWACKLLPGETYTATTTVDSTDCGPTPPSDLTITGGVYAGDLAGPAPSREGRLTAESAPIPGAVVTATTCIAGEWVAVTDAEGQYEIIIPGQTAEACDEVTLVVTAQGFGAAERIYTVADLRADGVRDFVLDPWLYVWLPLMWQ